MKKISLIFLIVLGCVLLASCGLSSVPPIPTATPVPEITTAPTPSPVPVIVPAGLENRVIIRIQDTELVANDPVNDAIPILSFRYQLPYVTIDNNTEAADTINSTLNELNNEYISPDGSVGVEMDKYNEMLSLANDSFDEENPQEEFKFFRKANIVRADDNVICISFSNTTYQLGNESTEEEIHYFDASTGMELSEELITEDAYPKADRDEKGTVSILDAVDDEYELVDLVEIDEDGADYMLACEGVIYDLYIGDDWYCNVLNNNAVQIKADLDENTTGLFVSYISAGEQYSYLIVKDPDSGKVSLVDTEEALG